MNQPRRVLNVRTPGVPTQPDDNAETDADALSADASDMAVPPVADEPVAGALGGMPADLKAYIDDEAPYHRSLGGSHDERKSLLRAFLCGGGRGLLSKYEAEHRCHADQKVLGFWEGGKTLQEPQGTPRKPNLHFLHFLHLLHSYTPPPAEMQRCRDAKGAKGASLGFLVGSCAPAGLCVPA